MSEWVRVVSWSYPGELLCLLGSGGDGRHEHPQHEVHCTLPVRTLVQVQVLAQTIDNTERGG